MNTCVRLSNHVMQFVKLMVKFVLHLERAGGHKPNRVSSRNPASVTSTVKSAAFALFDMLNKDSKSGEQYLNKDELSFLGDVLAKEWTPEHNKILMSKLDPSSSGKIFPQHFEVIEPSSEL